MTILMIAQVLRANRKINISNMHIHTHTKTPPDTLMIGQVLRANSKINISNMHIHTHTKTPPDTLMLGQVQRANSKINKHIKYAHSYPHKNTSRHIQQAQDAETWHSFPSGPGIPPLQISPDESHPEYLEQRHSLRL
jgi:ribosomal protein L24